MHSALQAPLVALVADLEALPASTFTAATIHRTLSGTVVDAAALAAALPWREGDYTRTRLHHGRRFELLAMAWAPGSASRIHDHAGQLCSLLLLAGGLEVEAFDLVWAGDQGQAGCHRGLRQRPGSVLLRPGDVDERGPADDIHRVHNRGPMPAVSLHVYARPFATCLIYDAAAPVARRQLLRLDARLEVARPPVPAALC